MLKPRTMALAVAVLIAMSTNVSAATSKERALVFGGGGPVGGAWEAGIVAGLAEQGISVPRADLIVGTSAGAVLGARLAMGQNPAELMVPPPPPPPRPLNAPPPFDPTPLFNRLAEAASSKKSAVQIRKEIGAWALTAPTEVTEAQAVAIFSTILPTKTWPSRAYECTAVDVADGALKVWNADSGIDLPRAVVSSASVPGIFPPIAIEGHRYMDGGLRSVTNADLAQGYKMVIVVAPTLGVVKTKFDEYSRAQLDGEVKGLRGSGSRVAVVVPDAASLAAFGLNMLDFSRSADAAKAGLAQGRTIGGKLKADWNR